MVALDMLRQWWTYLAYCFLSDFGDPACRDWWSGVMIAAFALGGIIAFALGRVILREYLEFRRNRLRLAARAIVDEAAIEEATWKGDALHGDPEALSTEELAARVRAALDARKDGQAEKKPAARIIRLFKGPGPK